MGERSSLCLLTSLDILIPFPPAPPRPPSLYNPAALPVLSCVAQREFPTLPDKPYDLVVLGSGPGGEAAAVQAARLGASVAVVEIKKTFGGPTGLTSKAVREAAKQINQAVKNVRGRGGGGEGVRRGGKGGGGEWGERGEGVVLSWCW